MVKDELKQQEAAIGEAVSKTEAFFEKNSKTFVAAVVAFCVVVGGVYGYRKLVAEPRVEKASELIAEAQYRFEQENADFALALNGDASAPGFAQVAEQYGNTPAGNLANMYAAACALRLGDYAMAEKYINDFSTVKGVAGEMINAMAIGIKGDIAVEQDDLAKAASLFEKAAAASDNQFTTPLYLRKASQAYRAMGNVEKANAQLQTIMEKYPSSIDSREATTYIGD